MRFFPKSPKNKMSKTALLEAVTFGIFFAIFYNFPYYYYFLSFF